VPRPLINKASDSALLSGPKAATSQTSRRVLTEPRSNRYLRAVARLDAGGQLGSVEIQKLVEDIHREFRDRYASIPVGIIGKCYLGDPFEVHTLAVDNSIIEHYRVGQALPHGLDRARTLANSEAYLAIEVYTDRMVCVRADGSVVAMEAGS
jgi:hypothetical protein